MKTTKLLLAVAALACGLLTTTGCKTTNPVTGVREFDPAKTEKVKAFSENISKIVLRRALTRFTNEAPTIELYTRALGGVFCEMQRTKQFSPESLEAGVEALVLPKLENPEALAYMHDARDIIFATYRTFYSDRFTAELGPEDWLTAVADIFCNSIDQGLRDLGKPGVKPGAAIPATAPYDRTVWES